MSQEQIISEAISDMKLAASMAQEASKLFYNASKKLERVSTRPSKKKTGLDESQIAKLIGRRMQKIKTITV